MIEENKSPLSGVMTKEKALEIADDIYYAKDGSVIADYVLKTCRGYGHSHRGCRAVYRIKPCGCIERRTWHYFVDEKENLTRAFFDDGSTRTTPDHYCKKHSYKHGTREATHQPNKKALDRL